MPNEITLSVDGRQVTVDKGTVVAVAIAKAGVERFRNSFSGQSRGPLCGMGLCFECRVTINDQPHCRSCQTICQQGMEVKTTDE